MTGEWEFLVHALPEYFIWFWVCDDRVPRAGVGVSTAADAAEVSYAALKDFSDDQHLQLLQLLDGCPTESAMSEELVRKEFAQAALTQPR